MVVLEKIVVDGLRHMEAAKLVSRLRRLLAYDAAGVGRVVAANIEEIANVVPAAAVENTLAIGLVGLVAGRAERGRWRAGDRFEPRFVKGSQIDEAVCAWPHQAAHAVAHAEDALHLAGGGKSGAQAFDDAGERLIDDGGRPSRLADDRIAGNKVSHEGLLPIASRAQCPTGPQLASCTHTVPFVIARLDWAIQ